MDGSDVVEIFLGGILCEGEISWKVFFGCVGNDWIGNSHLQVWNIRSFQVPHGCR